MSIFINGVSTRQLIAESLRTVGTQLYGSSTGAVNTTTATPIANKMYALPFYVGKAITLDRIGIETTAAAAGNARLGIYTDNNSIYPGTLLLDAGTVDVSVGAGTGVKLININQALTVDTLYWLVYLSDVQPTVRGWNAGNLTPILGYTPTLGQANSACTLYDVAQAYGTLPTPFTAGATLSQSFMPMIMVRLSA